MIDITGTVIVIVVILIVYFIIFKLIKSLVLFQTIFKILIILLTIAIGALIISGAFVISDAIKFNKEFSNSTNMFILQDENRYLTGISLEGDNKPTRAISSSELPDIKEDIDKGREPEKYYKVIIINIDVLEDMNKTIKINGIELTSKDIEKIMQSDEPKEEFARIASKNSRYSEEDILRLLSSKTDDDMKAALFTDIVAHFFKSGNMGMLLKEYKKDNIHVYAETAMFKAMKYTPGFLIGESISGLNITSDEKGQD